jgi:hypothetical protein
VGKREGERRLLEEGLAFVGLLELIVGDYKLGMDYTTPVDLNSVNV